MTITFRARTVQGFFVDSPIQPFTFPGGEAHLKISESKARYQYQIADVRGASALDLMMLAMWEDATRQRGERTVVFMPYLPGARADRGVPFGSRVYAEFLNNLYFDQIITLDPHSPVMPALLSGTYDGLHVGGDDTIYTEFPVERIIKREIQDGSKDSGPHPYAGVIAPDKGAVDRATRAARVMGVPVYKAEKSRDFETGKLTGFHMVDKLPDQGRFLVVDDVADGSGTFNGLADVIGIGPDRLDLWVTHGIFSKGFRELRKRFGIIHTTDSWDAELKTNQKNHLTVHSIVSYLTSAIQ